MTMRAAVTCVVLALAAAGCGGDETAAPAGGSTPDGRLAAPLGLEVTGGEEGRRDRMTIRPDGTASIETRKGRTSAELSEEELSTVSEQFAGAKLADLPEDSLTKPPIPDALAYSFSYEGREVSTDAGSLPERVKPLLGTLLGLLERHGPG
jgi:hypothetical protein